MPSFFGLYALREVLGKEGLATIYYAFDTEKEKDVLLKILQTNLLTPEDNIIIKKRFLQEIKTIASLRHQNILEVVKFGEISGRPYVAMRKCEGRTLQEKLQEQRQLTWIESGRIIQPIIDALIYSNSLGVHHKDIKPANIFISSPDVALIQNYYDPVIMMNEISLDPEFRYQGSIAYQAPELTNNHVISVSNEIYSMGIVLYEMITGYLPFRALGAEELLSKQMKGIFQPASQIVQNVPVFIDKVLSKALCPNPEERYQTLELLANDLRSILPVSPPELPNSVTIIPELSSLTKEGLSDPLLGNPVPPTLPTQLPEIGQNSKTVEDSETPTASECQTVDNEDKETINKIGAEDQPEIFELLEETNPSEYDSTPSTIFPVFEQNQEEKTIESFSNEAENLIDVSDVESSSEIVISEDHLENNNDTKDYSIDIFESAHSENDFALEVESSASSGTQQEQISTVENVVVDQPPILPLPIPEPPPILEPSILVSKIEPLPPAIPPVDVQIPIVDLPPTINPHSGVNTYSDIGGSDASKFEAILQPEIKQNLQGRQTPIEISKNNLVNESSIDSGTLREIKNKKHDEPIKSITTPVPPIHEDIERIGVDDPNVESQQVAKDVKTMSRQVIEQKIVPDNQRKATKRSYATLALTLELITIFILILLIVLTKPKPNANYPEVEVPTQTESVSPAFDVFSQIGNGTINGLASSPDGNLLAVLSSSGIYLYSVDTLELIDRFPTGKDQQGLAFSPDGTKMATGINSSNVTIIDAQNGKPILTHKPTAGNVTCFAFSPDGKFLAIGSNSGSIDLLDIETFQLVFTIQSDGDQVTSLAFSPDGSFLLAGSDKGVLSYWSVSNGQIVRSVNTNNDSTAIKSIAISSDGAKVASGDNNGIITILNFSSSEIINSLRHPNLEKTDLASNPIMSMVFSPDGNTLTSTYTSENTFSIWDIKGSYPYLSLTDPSNQNNIYSMLSPDGVMDYSASTSGQVTIRNTATNSIQKPQWGFTNQIADLSISPDGSTLASVSNDQVINLWDVNNREWITSIQGNSGNLISIAFSSDGTLLASGGNDSVITIWDSKNQQEIAQLKPNLGRVIDLKFSPDNQFLLCPTENGKIIFYETRKWTQSKILDVHSDPSTKNALSPNNEFLAITTNTGSIQIWDLENEVIFRNLQINDGEANSIEFSPDDALLVVGLNNQEITIWDISTGNKLTDLIGFADSIIDLAFSPDGSTLAASSYSEGVTLWSTSTWEKINTLDNSIHSQVLLFSPNGQTIISGTANGFINIWN